MEYSYYRSIFYIFREFSLILIIDIYFWYLNLISILKLNNIILLLPLHVPFVLLEYKKYAIRNLLLKL